MLVLSTTTNTTKRTYKIWWESKKPSNANLIGTTNQTVSAKIIPMYTPYFGRDQAEQLTCSTIKSKVITVKALFYALRLVELGVVVVVVGGGGVSQKCQASETSLNFI